MAGRRLPELHPCLLGRSSPGGDGKATGEKAKAGAQMPVLRPSRSDGNLGKEAQIRSGKQRRNSGNAASPLLPGSEKASRSPSPAPRRRARSRGEVALVEEVPGLQEAFRKICGSRGEASMDSRQFDKFCREAGYMDSKFTTADADLLFTTVTGRGLRRLGALHFQSALRLLAERKRLPMDQVCAKVRRLAEAEERSRPPVAAVPPGNDSAMVPWNEEVNCRGRSSRGVRSSSEPAPRGWFYPLDNGCCLKRNHTDGVDGAESELLMDSFVSFCWGKPDMSNRDFLRLCRDCHLLSNRFTALDADLLFTKVLPKMQRRMKFEDFEVALRQLAERKGVAMSAIRQAIAFAHGPFVQATEADAIRLHDDISSYTGTHVHGGPESGALGLGTVNLWR